jgi:hypothetical protein
MNRLKLPVFLSGFGLGVARSRHKALVEEE